MKEMKEYFWVLPIIAGILSIVALLAPAVYFPTGMGVINIYFWLWGLLAINLTYGYPTINYSGFVLDPMTFIPSLLNSVILVISTIILFITANKARRSKINLKNLSYSLAILGILCIASNLIWIILIGISFPISVIDSVLPGFSSIFGSSFWAVLSIGFGAIVPFISGSIAIISGIAVNYYSKERPVKIPEKKEVIPPTEKPSPPIKAEFDTCPECEAKIEDPSTKFCGKCGFEFKIP